MAVAVIVEESLVIIFDQAVLFAPLFVELHVFKAQAIALRTGVHLT